MVPHNKLFESQILGVFNYVPKKKVRYHLLCTGTCFIAKQIFCYCGGMWVRLATGLVVWLGLRVG